jgi:hypothetical protein
VIVNFEQIYYFWTNETSDCEFWTNLFFLDKWDKWLWIF